MRYKKLFITAVLGLLMFLALSAESCSSGSDGGTPAAKARRTIANEAKGFTPYIPHNHVELNNYNNAQKLYDSPSTIIWCSTTWGNPSAPIVTVPIAGKLTSSSTTFFQPEAFFDRGNYSWQSGTARSVDGLFHPNPPQYRYGFTPGGQYVDFFNMPTVCTTALSKFQRQETKLSIEVDPGGAAATKQAEVALRSGDKNKAQAILSKLGSGK